jgi:predicted amidohydrolase
MNIHLVQYDIIWENKKKNQQKILKLLTDEISPGSLMVFPEMTLTGFSMNTGNLAETFNGESFNFFTQLAIKYSSDVIAGIIEKGEGKFFNTLLHISSKGILINSYKKIHPFSYSNENKFYTGGNKPVVTKINEWKTGLSICYDLRFPELFRHYAKERVDLIINIANWPIPRIEHWRTLLKARAIENQCYVAGVNRIGKDPNGQYNGFSSLFDPMGKEVISAENEEKIITIEIDKENVKQVREKLPFLNDIKLI